MFPLRHLTLGLSVISLTLGTMGGMALALVRPPVIWTQSDSSSEAAQLVTEGIKLYRIGQWQQTLDRWQRALVLYHQAGDRLEEAKTLINIGIIYGLLGDYAKALDYQTQSLDLTRELGDRAGEAKTLGNIGVIYQLLGDYAEALDYQIQSLDLTRELGDRAGEAKTLTNIGVIYEQMKDESAIAFYQESIAIYEELRKGNQSLLPDLQEAYTAEIEFTYRRLSNLLRREGRTAEAQRVLELLE